MSEIKVKYPATVSFSAGATINMGNFQSVRINVGLTVPVYDMKKIDVVYEKVIAKVEKMLEKKVNEYMTNKQDEILVEDFE